VVLRTRHFSTRIDGRTLGANLGLCVLVLGAALWSLVAGDFPMAVDEVLRTLVGMGEATSGFVIFGLRLPRLLTGVFTGVALGVAGAIFQSLARNPLASPDVIGFDSGAALGAVATVVLLGASGIVVALGAIAGGIGTAMLVFGLAWRNGVSPLRLVLIGIGVGAFAYAGVDFLMTRSDIFAAAAAQAWLVGSLNARLWSHVGTVGAGVIVLVPAALLLQPALDRIELGDDLAAALGIRVNRTRLMAGLAAILLAALGVASAGPLPFVAFVAGPIARRVTGASGLSLLTAGLVGALVVTLGDLAGRLLFAPTQLPVGVFTAIFGAPYLLWLLATQIRKGTM
jgi:iron complex transport system permease protein